MSWPTVPNSFSPATKARSSEINSNFSAIKDAIASSVTKSNTDYVITDTDGYRVILVSTGNTTRTITLPTAADNSQRIITIKKVDSGTGAVTIDGENSETIDGQLTKSLNVQYDFYELQCDGTTWNIISTSSASSGSGAGSVNYIQTSSKAWDMEATITGWNTYKDAAAATPVDGTGGSPTVITIARNTTTPLNGVADLKISKSAANGQGEGVSIDVTVPSGYQYAQKGQIKLLLNSNTTNFVADDFVFYVYDVTNSTLITPNVTSMSKYKGAISITWDSSATGTSYRLIMHCAVTTTLAYDIYIDDVIFGPGVTAQGAVVTPWQSFTPTLSWTTNATNVGYWRRVGSEMEMRVMASYSGASSAGDLLLTMPTGYTIDASAIPGNSFITNMLTFGYGSILDNGTNIFSLNPYVSSSTVVGFKRVDASGTYVAYPGGVDATTPITIASGDKVHFYISVPIAEWAGSGTVNLGNNGIMSVSNDGSGGTTANTNYSTGMVNGPAGSQFVSVASTTGSNSSTGYKVTWPYPVNPSTVVIEVTSDSGTTWLGNSSNATNIGRLIQGTSDYGIWYEAIDSTSGYVKFGNKGRFASNATYAGDGSTWAGIAGSAQYKWRASGQVAGQAVGFGLATATQSGLVSAEQNGSVSSTFTFNGSGGTSSATTISYSRVGKVVTLTVAAPQATTGTSSSQFISNTAIDSWARPAATVTGAIAIVENNSYLSNLGVILVDSNGTVYIKKSAANTAWTNSTANSGLASVNSFSYLVP